MSLLANFPKVACSADGEPAALRYWPNGLITLETHWGHNVVLSGKPKEKEDYDCVIEPDKKYNHLVSRLPNEGRASVIELPNDREDPSAITLVSNGVNLKVSFDGIVVQVVRDPSNAKISKGDVVVPIGVEVLRKTSQMLVASKVPAVLIAAREDAQKLDRRFQMVEHNTHALCSAQQAESTQLVALGTTPWEMPETLAKEFKAMEKSCASSQAVFAKLSAEQLNFRPQNGTHTPRWNCEHMMGRQLLFFSQIYNKIDSTIPVMNLNPKQMPPDYEFAHPDWNGQEEARQMQRVSEFTRRFAYLLEGKKQSDKATGTFWPTIGALLKQMQRHYGEHTANTVKKFDLPGFPK
ncbi:MAG TPA: hypothetical protein DDW52_03270 [Planctomycetaceae bacterium]|nr:hypothetical protein [Planctomycetaceae bacterium]